ncbi:MAG: hypothetical protein H0T76_20910, partial [Nannocystis sp.]|nr:hypothetical protein [Nannocystis sp.]
MDQIVAIRPPSRAIPKEGPQNLRDLDREALAAWLESTWRAAGSEPPPRHRADQLFRWLHQRRA